MPSRIKVPRRPQNESSSSKGCYGSRMHAICVVGARPNFMKVKPVMDAIERRGGRTTLVHTGQHYDPAMSAVFFDELGIRQPDRHLQVGSGTHAEQTGRVMAAFEPLLHELAADFVVVVGDVNSTMACAVTAAKAGPLVAHVEAGLRSRDWGMPEEVNRVITDRVSDLLLSPSEDASVNLSREGCHPERVHLVGNVMVDTLLANVKRARERSTVADLGLQAGGYGLVTLHRPANVDDPRVLGPILDALMLLAQHLQLVLPAHPRTREQLRPLADEPGIQVIDPVGYLDFVALQDAAALVLTDSGGVQEETTVLGVPCLTLRDNTERPITITHGTNRLVGRDPAVILREALKALGGERSPRRPPLWDGRAGQRIADVLLSADASSHPRPTDESLPAQRPNTPIPSRAATSLGE